MLAGMGLAGQSPLASWQERGLRCSGAEVAEVLKVAHLLLPYFTPALVPSILLPPVALAPGSQPAFSPTWLCRPPHPSAHHLKDKFTPFPCKKFTANPYWEPAEITKIECSPFTVPDSFLFKVINWAFTPAFLPGEGNLQQPLLQPS